MNSSVSPNKKRSPRILIIDDDMSIIELVRDFLTLEGFESDYCNSGEEAIEYLRKNRVALILLDIVMPGMSGIDVARKIRKDSIDKGFIPIIIVSAMVEEKDKILGLQYADDYITKPFSYEELKARINALLRLSQLQNELLVSKERYQFLYENIPEMCISLDKERRVSDCNTEFCKCFGVQKGDVVRKNVLDFFHKDEHELLLSFFDSLKPQKVSDNQHIFRMPGNSKKGKSVYVSIRAVYPAEHETGLDIIAAMKDVSKSIELEKQQRLARQQLYRSARMASIGSLASGTAHEMNNPLTAILGFSDALLHRFDDNEKIEDHELQQYLGIIKSEALRCRDVVDNLLKFSRDYESQVEKVSLFDCIHSVVSLMNTRAKKKSIKIIDKVGRDVFVNIDAQKIRQVLVNIISNSLDFCENGSQIKIDAEINEDKNEPIRLKISDIGPGIPKEVQPKIFDPFFTTKEVGKGVGLGLTISYKLMEECQGSIDIISEENRGTTVILEIPRN
ncbi:ATP-binding protein [Fibrobacterota bacterium]